MNDYTLRFLHTHHKYLDIKINLFLKIGFLDHPGNSMPLGKRFEVQLILGVLFHCHEKEYPRKAREKRCVYLGSWS